MIDAVCTPNWPSTMTMTSSITRIAHEAREEADHGLIDAAGPHQQEPAHPVATSRRETIQPPIRIRIAPTTDTE
jgi:hypothetical protein